MKAIKDINKYPKFLKVNDVAPKESWNKYLPKPWVEGEVVRVAPAEEQVSSPSVGTPTEIWRKQYVKVIRKDDEGKWTLKHVHEWKTFELLTNKSRR